MDGSDSYGHKQVNDRQQKNARRIPQTDQSRVHGIAFMQKNYT